MKKSLIALAALSAFATAAQAQSSVTVYGVLDIGYSETTNSMSNIGGVNQAKNKVTSTGNGDGGLATSRLGFKGTEDLGGGTKANFQLEYDLLDSGTQATPVAGGVTPAGEGNNTSSFGARYSWVGLENAKLGQLRLGRQESSAHSVVVAGSTGGANNTAGTIYSAGGRDTGFAGTLGADANSGVRPHAVFVNKAVTYISPTISGITLEAQMARYEDTTSIVGAPQTLAAAPAAIARAETKSQSTGASLKYAAGAFAAAYGYQQNKATTLVIANDTKYTVDILSASYDFGVAKAFVLHASGKQNEAITAVEKSKNTEIGVQVPVGKAVLWASAFDGDLKGSGTVAQTFSQDTSGYQVGARYDLSKRTALYTIYGEQERKGTSVGLIGLKSETKQLTAGVRHSF